ncbi:diaminopimelate epimerase, partial [Xanthomonas fragariae]
MSAEASSGRLRFTKMHGAGNDFVVLDLRHGTPPPDAALVAQLADRHFGVGCDQILTIEAPRSSGAVAAYGIWNSDGSAARQCGNGARCVAAWLVRDGTAQGDRFIIESPFTAHAVERLDEGIYSVAMGVPQFAPPQIPLAGFAHAREEYALPVHGETLRFGAVSMGNPHAVVEVGRVDA